MPRGFLRFALGCALAFGLAGCGGSSGTTVKGKVLSDGQPVAGAEVHFEGKGKGSEGRYSASRTDDAGNFEIKPVGEKSMKPGTYQVQISRFVDKKNQMPSAEDYEQLKAAGQLHNELPSRFSDPAVSELKAEVKEGQNVLAPFEVGGKGKGK
jgi:hypothetical protein